MTPEERALLDDLFQRLRQAESQPRDPDAERFIRETIQAQPAAAYYMAQSLLVQQHALTGAQQRIEDLERQLKNAQQPRPQSGGGSFLGNAVGLGRHDGPRPTSQPGRSPSGLWGAPAQPAYPPQPSGSGFRPGPWGGAPGAGFAPQRSGGFMGGALQTAAGVAGGILAASAISSMLHSGGSPFGAASASHEAQPGSDTVINDDQNAFPPPETHDTGYQEAAYQPDDADYPIDDAELGGDEGDWA